MPIITILVGDLLTLLGLITFFAWEQLGSPHRSVTALIPAFVGIPLVVLGFLARKPNLRMHAMHAAVVIALLGFIASAGRLIAKGDPPTTVGPIAQLIMAALTGIYVVLCVRSFISARRKRQAESATPL